MYKAVLAALMAALTSPAFAQPDFSTVGGWRKVESKATPAAGDDGREQYNQTIRQVAKRGGGEIVVFVGVPAVGGHYNNALRWDGYAAADKAVNPHDPAPDKCVVVGWVKADGTALRVKPLPPDATVDDIAAAVSAVRPPPPPPPVTEHTVQVPIARENRVRNRTGMQCGYASAEALLRHHGYQRAAELAQYPGPCPYDGFLVNVLNRLGVRARLNPVGRRDASFLERACAAKHGVVVNYTPSHIVTLVHFKDGKAVIIDNSDPTLRLKEMPAEAFLSRWNGWAVEVLPPGAPDEPTTPNLPASQPPVTNVTPPVYFTPYCPPGRV